MGRLRAELLGLFATDTARRVATEALLPWATQALTRWHGARGGRRTPSAAAELAREEYEAFDDWRTRRPDPARPRPRGFFRARAFAGWRW